MIRAVARRCAGVALGGVVLVAPMGAGAAVVESAVGVRGQPAAGAALSRDEAEAARDELWRGRLARLREERAAEWAQKTITLEGKSMRFEVRTFGDKPEGRGRSLFISLHGGGSAAPAVNDKQWRNQIDLYQPEEGVYIAPRAPTDTWNLWHEAHVDAMLDRLIQDAVALADVDPDRVYLMGYSAGGDGVYQLGGRMADRFAAAAMMAGHPNDASPLGLRNLPFAIHVGENDRAFKRNEMAAAWGRELDGLRANDAGGYDHVVKLHAGQAHWMNRRDAEALAWMRERTRTATPSRVVWVQDDVTHAGQYWLGVDEAGRRKGAIVAASIDGQRVTIERGKDLGGAKLTIKLDDRILDLDRPVVVVMAGRTLFEGVVARTRANLAASLEERGDPSLVFPARVTVELPAGAGEGAGEPAKR